MAEAAWDASAGGTGGRSGNNSGGSSSPMPKTEAEREAALDEYLTQQGRSVRPNPDEGAPGAGRQGDRFVDGVKTEYKWLDPGATSASIRNSINNSLRRGGQARVIIVDARWSGLSAAEAQQGMARAAGISRGRVDVIEIVGNGFHLHLRVP